MVASVGRHAAVAAAVGARRNDDASARPPSNSTDLEAAGDLVDQCVSTPEVGSRPTTTTRKERNRCLSCFECIMLGPLFTVFMVLQYTHLSLATSYKIERVLKFEFISKKFGPYAHTVDEVHDSKLFWAWIESALNETLAVQQDQLGHFLPRKEWGYLVQFNKVIGGVRMVQDRGQKHACPGPSASTSTCYNHIPDLEPFGYPPCNETHPPTNGSRQGKCYYPGEYAGVVNTQENEGFTLDNYTGHFEMWLDTREPKHLLQKRLEYLEDRHWIDKQTRKVLIEIFIRNDQFEPLVSEVIFEFTFDLTGYIHEKAFVETVPADPYKTNAALKLSLGTSYVLWNLALLLFFLLEKSSGSGCCCCSREKLLANASEAFSIVVALGQVALWCIYLPLAWGILERMGALRRPQQSPRHDGTDEHFWVEYHHQVVDIEERAHEAIAVMRLLRELSSVTLVCVLLRHFRVWDGIPSFAAVSRTMSLSAMRLSAVLLAGMTLVVIFAGAAMLNFGTQMSQFHTLSRAVQEAAVIAITGDPDVYNEMNLIDPIFAAIWFWALIAVMFMVVLNMILGILVDAASSASSEEGRTCTPNGTEEAVGLSEQIEVAMRVVRHPTTFFGRRKTHEQRSFEEGRAASALGLECWTAEPSGVLEPPPAHKPRPSVQKRGLLEEVSC